MCLWLLILITVGHVGGAIDAHRKFSLPFPLWYEWTASGLMFAANFLVTTVLAYLLVWIAQRQRMKLVWPLAGMAVILFIGIHGQLSRRPQTRRLSITLTTHLSLLCRARSGWSGFHPLADLAGTGDAALPAGGLAAARMAQDRRARMKRLAIALLLLAAPAMAQDAPVETIEVIGAQSLAGIWKIDFPAGIPISIPLVVRGTFSEQDAFCRIEEAKNALTVHCLPWNGDGIATVDEKSLHLAWGVALFRFVIDAADPQPPAFTGAYRLKMFGLGHEAPTPASGRKLAPSAGAPDTAGQGATLLASLKAIADATAPPMDDVMRKNFGMAFGGAPATTAATLQGLGAPAQAIYLGASTPPEIPPPPDAKGSGRYDARPIQFFPRRFQPL